VVEGWQEEEKRPRNPISSGRNSRTPKANLLAPGARPGFVAIDKEHFRAGFAPLNKRFSGIPKFFQRRRNMQAKKPNGSGKRSRAARAKGFERMGG